MHGTYAELQDFLHPFGARVLANPTARIMAAALLTVSRAPQVEKMSAQTVISCEIEDQFFRN